MNNSKVTVNFAVKREQNDNAQVTTQSDSVSEHGEQKQNKKPTKTRNINGSEVFAACHYCSQEFVACFVVNSYLPFPMGNQVPGAAL